jgi:alpha,alpha-trehalase
MSNICTIFCTGIILHTVQLKGIYNDSKTFVDMPLKFSPSLVMENFLKLPNATTKAGPSDADVRNFLAENFNSVGSDLVPYRFSDWKAEPPFLDKLKGIHDNIYFEWAKAVHKIWLELGRESIDDVRDNPTHHSLLYTPNPIVVPGGRFRESYYWDTYWIVKGLLVSDMLKTAQGVVENLLYFVDKYDHVPNGGRIYYLTRSQPPLLSEMVRVVYEALLQQEQGEILGNTPSSMKFLEKAVPLLDKEYHFWKVNRSTTNSKFFPLSIYNANSKDPRPESYREDYVLAKDINNKQEKDKLYQNLAAAAESGWDFSSRWFKDNNVGIASIDTTSIIPVDLNSYLFKFEINMYHFKLILKNEIESTKYLNLAKARYLAMEKYLWNEKFCQWMDLDMTTETHTESIAASNFVPLSIFSSISDSLEENIIKINSSHIERSLQAFKESGLVGVAGIKSTTLTGTNQQWDAPNSWAPMVDVIVEGLVKHVKVDGANIFGKQLAKAWLETNLLGYQKKHYMYEKYDADKVGVGGGGGEYIPQLGFGWTNGVALVFLNELWF